MKGIVICDWLCIGVVSCLLVAFAFISFHLLSFNVRKNQTRSIKNQHDPIVWLFSRGWIKFSIQIHRPRFSRICCTNWYLHLHTKMGFWNIGIILSKKSATPNLDRFVYYRVLITSQHNMGACSRRLGQVCPCKWKWCVLFDSVSLHIHLQRSPRLAESCMKMYESGSLLKVTGGCFWLLTSTGWCSVVYIYICIHISICCMYVYIFGYIYIVTSFVLWGGSDRPKWLAIARLMRTPALASALLSVWPTNCWGKAMGKWRWGALGMWCCLGCCRDVASALVLVDDCQHSFRVANC